MLEGGGGEQHLVVVPDVQPCDPQAAFCQRLDAFLREIDVRRVVGESLNRQKLSVRTRAKV